MLNNSRLLLEIIVIGEMSLSLRHQKSPILFHFQQIRLQIRIALRLSII